MAEGRGGPLRGVRVIDLATERAELAGRVLADLGADVIAVEPPGGSPSRRMPPFARGREQHPDGSLYWAAVSLGKRCVTLDIETDAGHTELLRLLDGADVVIESFDPGVMARLRLGYEHLRERFPGLVYVSVSPCGQTGPDATSPATALTVEAAGGLLGLQGDGDRPPVPVGYPQAWFHAGVQAAADAIIALNERHISGLGQWLDLSAQAAVVWTLMHATGYPSATGDDPPRTGPRRADPPPELVPGVSPRGLWACADGYVVCSINLGRLGARTFHAVMRWLEEEDALDPALRGIDWREWSAEVQEGRLRAEQVTDALDAIARFFATKSKSELLERAVQDRMLLAPVNTVADVANDVQLAAREYWVTVDGRTHPGAFARFSETPITLGTSPAEITPHSSPHVATTNATRAVPPSARPASSPRARAFDGLKVADFAWVGVGPLISKTLADNGATVVHVESATRPDVLRGMPPFKDRVPGVDRSQFMANFNTSKLGLALDLATEGGRAVARRLTGWADVVVESFTPGTMARLGLDYETLRADHSDLIMLSTCLRGQTGPHRGFGGFGGQGAAMAGIHGITGWPDRPPIGPWGAYTDFVAPRYGVAALASALLHRSRIGTGQHVDLSQVEAAIHFIEPLVLDYTVNGAVAAPTGAASPTAAPHGVYPAAGEERYVAVAVETTAQWHALRGLGALPAFYADRFDAVEARLAHRAEIDSALAAWTRPQEPWRLAEWLKGAGVPASVVLRPSDLFDDPQLAARSFFVPLEHRVMGRVLYDGPVTRFSATSNTPRFAAPCLGQHTEPVLRDLLGYGADEIAALAASGILS